jgi:hypothetical protein
MTREETGRIKEKNADCFLFVARLLNSEARVCLVLLVLVNYTTKLG